MTKPTHLSLMFKAINSRAGVTTALQIMAARIDLMLSALRKKQDTPFLNHAADLRRQYLHLSRYLHADHRASLKRLQTLMFETAISPPQVSFSQYKDETGKVTRTTVHINGEFDIELMRGKFTW